MWCVFICDTDEQAREALEKQLMECAGEYIKKIRSFSTGEELLFYMVLHPEEAQIIMVDILLADNISGIDIGKRIKENNPAAQLIFMSGTLGFSEDVYEVEHVYFVRKPVERRKLKDAVLRAGKKVSDIEAGCLAVVTKKEAMKIQMSDIVYLENDKRLVRIHLAHEEVTCYGKLDDLMPRLSWNFIKCHNSYIVNAFMVQGIKGNYFLLKGDKKIPISKAYHKAAKERFLEFLSRMV